MNITPEMVKQLRELTGAGIMACKEALKEVDGNVEKASENLRKKGLVKAANKSSRVTKEGVIGSYIHHGDKIGVMVELNCETDFVAKNQEFRTLVKDIAMQIAAANPKYLKPEDVPADIVDKEKEILTAEAKNSGKPDSVIEKMMEGKIRKYFEEICLLEQPYVKEPDKKVKDRIVEAIAVLGENIQIRRFTRYQLGEN